MTQTPAVFASFTLERRYPVPPARVFAAFADRALKARWFEDSGGWTALERKFDFRVGGIDRAVGRWPSGTVTTFDAHFHDIVPDRRIVFAYGLHIDDRLISVSLATIEFFPEATGTRLVLTEQGAFLDGYEDNGAREHGTGLLLERMGATLAD